MEEQLIANHIITGFLVATTILSIFANKDALRKIRADIKHLDYCSDRRRGDVADFRDRLHDINISRLKSESMVRNYLGVEIVESEKRLVKKKKKK